MPQNEHIEEFQRRNGKRFDHEEKSRKRKARAVHKDALHAKRIHGIRAILHNKKRYKEKAAMKKTIKAHKVRVSNCGSNISFAETYVLCIVFE